MARLRPPYNPAQLRGKRGTYIVTPAEKRTRFDIASRLLFTGSRTPDIGKALKISTRQAQRMLRDKEFNDHYDEYRKAQMSSLDRAIQGRIVELLPIIPSRMRELIMQDDSREVAFRACEAVLDRCGVKMTQSEAPRSLMPAQMEALKNAASIVLDGFTRRAPALPGPSDDTEASGKGVGDRPSDSLED